MLSPRLLPALCGLCLIARASAVPVAEQQVLSLDQDDRTESSRHLTGRFLHITDFHLDPNYKPGTSDERVCHWDKGSAGPLGAEGTECDSPPALIDETFRWIEKNLKGKIDFVLWTGDSARHDNDEQIPRTADEIVELNEVLAAKFIDLFQDGSAARGLSIPVIPTIGNNDIMPHNIFKEAPNRWTRKFTEVWSSFIPEHQRHTFEEGGWFSADLIPNKLAAISLNTMYFYESNSAVDGCAAKTEPGYEHMEWLRVQFELLRERKMKAILIGHVPPARSGDKRSWDESCWQKYTLFVNRFRDVVVGSAYGHMNVDHFMLQDSRDIDLLNASQDSAANNDTSVQSRSTYLSSLREDWAGLPSPPGGKSSKFLSDEWIAEASDSIDAARLGKKERKFLKKIGGPYAERYSVTLVSPSVIPNYFPTLRVVDYNTTGLEGIKLWADTPYSPDLFEHFDWDAFKNSTLEEINDDSNTDGDTDLSENDDNDMTEQGKKKKHKKNKNKKDKSKKKKPNFKVPDEPSKSTPPGPAYSDQALTWLSYAQYYANLTDLYNSKSDSSTPSSESENVEDTAKSFNLYQLEYDTREDTVYKMKDLTVRSFFHLAKRIANKRPRKEDIYAESDSDAEAEEEDEPADSPTDESDLEDDDNDNDDSEESTNKANKKNKKNNKKKAKRNKNARTKKHKNRVWRTFLDRAFVGFLSDDELDDI